MGFKPLFFLAICVSLCAVANALTFSGTAIIVINGNTVTGTASVDTAQQQQQIDYTFGVKEQEYYSNVRIN